MLILLTGFSTIASVFKLIFLLIVFILILAASQYFTRWYAKSGLIRKQSGNISIIETYQVAPGKNIYIAKIGDKYVSFMVSKDNIVKLTELDEDELAFHEVEQNIKETSFKDVFSKMIANRSKKK